MSPYYNNETVRETKIFTLMFTIVDNKRRDKCSDFTMMCVLLFVSKNNFYNRKK